MECVSRALARSPLPPLAVPRGIQPSDDLRTPPELLSSVPDQVCQTAQAGVELLGRLPSLMAEDLKVAANNLPQVPRKIAPELLQTPGQMTRRLAPYV